jgi:8-oxo-dGTP pyrophosphatase MutT (NUDIX family)
MRYEEAARRLAHLPATLPEPPGELAPHVTAAGRVRLREIPGTRVAAVLVLVYPGLDGDAFVLLMERPAGDLRHAGEISFPGGAVEEADTSLAAAALREAREEVGLDPEQAGVRIVGLLDPVDVRVSGFELVPVVCLAERRPELTADPREVASIVEAPLGAFVAGAAIEIVDEVRAGWRLHYGAYPVAGHRIWGATARVLGQLGAILAG